MITRHIFGPLKDHYERLLENGAKPAPAELTIARKVAAIVVATSHRGRHGS